MFYKSLIIPKYFSSKIYCLICSYSCHFIPWQATFLSTIHSTFKRALTIDCILHGPRPSNLSVITKFVSIPQIKTRIYLSTWCLPHRYSPRDRWLYFLWKPLFHHLKYGRYWKNKSLKLPQRYRNLIKLVKWKICFWIVFVHICIYWVWISFETLKTLVPTSSLTYCNSSKCTYCLYFYLNASTLHSFLPETIFLTIYYTT